jgi:hypothetical protein
MNRPLNPHVVRIYEQPGCHAPSEHCGSMTTDYTKLKPQRGESQKNATKNSRRLALLCLPTGEIVRPNGNEVGYMKNKKYYERQEDF